ncbi:hypothetical protein JTE90_007704 [Oedothorax gibbosus]|uniref:DNA polymerase n=1 Tax=Oedothorax gibbosus TaxID=931172 RepID=A0AAV6TLQ6_9ARAC|nr:hypothetical protein JTE90_007704 [Oedothorax gibbosus]
MSPFKIAKCSLDTISTDSTCRVSFSRLLWLGMHSILRQYSSARVGETLVTTFQNKLVLDLYHYFKTFSNYDLPGFKLDDVARIKLGETKIPVQSTGIWCWYTRPEASSVMGAAVEECHRVLKPHRVPVEQFGTFRQYLEYCLKDSFLVKRLFDKEMVLSFAVERANFAALNAMQALYMGNSNFLLELLKSYGNVLGFFINTRFFSSPIDVKKYESVLTKNKTYQGALNFCTPETPYKDVSVMDFASMYPSALLSSNLCYSSCTIMTSDEWVACPLAQSLTTIPYRIHSERDFETNESGGGEQFHYPTFDPEKDKFAIVINEGTEAFLPCVVKHFIQLRKHHQAIFKETKDVYHYNVQLCIKILINSLYGIMANKNSCLAYLPIAMAIVTLARYQLLGSYHYLSRLGYTVCYADTDSLMVHRWPDDHCHAVNTYLNLPHVELKFEQRMLRILFISKKRYVYQTQKGEIVTKGFQKRRNELLETITQIVLDNVWSFIYQTPNTNAAWTEDDLSLESRGWLLWVHVLQLALYKCRDAKKYSICRKTKPLSEYKSKTCATVRMLQKYPEKANDYIEYTHSRADVAEREANQWIVDAQDCQWVNYEKLIVSQKKMFCLLLNIAFWKRAKVPMDLCDMVLNAIRWKQFMHAELLHRNKTGRCIEMLVESGTRYTFKINNHSQRTPGRRCVRRKVNDGKSVEEKTTKKRKVETCSYHGRLDGPTLFCFGNVLLGCHWKPTNISNQKSHPLLSARDGLPPFSSRCHHVESQRMRQRDVRQFLQWCYANLQEKLKTPDIVFGYKGPNQRDFLLRHGISNIVDMGTIGVPSLSLLKQLYVPPLCPLHVSPYSKCALAAVNQ